MAKSYIDGTNGAAFCGPIKADGFLTTWLSASEETVHHGVTYICRQGLFRAYLRALSKL
jgi:hypothetical protein